MKFYYIDKISIAQVIKTLQNCKSQFILIAIYSWALYYFEFMVEV